MGTNFYWKMPEAKRHEITLPTGKSVVVGSVLYDDMDPIIHIGKRSAAGYFCWDCNVTLCKGGKSKVHKGRSPVFRVFPVARREQEWHETCPKCGKKRIEEGFSAGAAAVELGFAKPRPERPTGVRTCSSFTWAQSPKKVQEVCEQRPLEQLIRDEYDRDLTCRDFIQMIEFNCPIIYKSIGQQFS